MSYSFTVLAANKAEAKARVAVEMAKVVSGQLPHAKEAAAATAAAHALIDTLDDACTGIHVNMNGSVSCQDWCSPGVALTSATVGISVSGS